MKPDFSNISNENFTNRQPKIWYTLPFDPTEKELKEFESLCNNPAD